MEEHKPLVSILIVNTNGKDVLDPCLQSLKKSLYSNFEVIIVDNGSTDGSVQMIEANHPDVKLIKSPTNIGFAAGNNLAYEQAKGKYAVLLNGDTEVEPDWLDHLVEFAERHPEAGALTPKVLFFSDRKTINSAGGLCDIFGFSPLRGTFEEDRGQYDKVEEVFYSHGAAMLFRKDLIDKIGLFDDTYFIYHEELDLCWRIWLSGYKVYYIPDSIVYHKVQQRTFYAKEKLAKRHFLLKKNRIRNLIKNHKNPFLVIYSLIGFFFISSLELLYYLIVKRDLESPKGMIEGFWWNIKVLPDTLRKRKEVQAMYKVPESEVLKGMSKIPYAWGIFLGVLRGKYSLPL